MSSALEPTPPQAAHKRAAQALRHIEHRTAHILDKLQLATAFLLEQTAPAAAVRPVPTIADLEKHAVHWRFLVPEEAAARAALIHLLAEKYALSQEATPEALSYLGADDAAVAAAYQQLYDQPLADALQGPPPAAPTESPTIEGLEWLYLRRGETLFQQGDPAEKVYMLLEGLLRAEAAGSDDEAPPLRIGPGQLVGEVALLTNEPHDATVLALRDSDIVYLTRASFDRFVAQHPQAMRALTVQVIDRLRRTVRQPTPSTPAKSFALLPATPGLGDFTPQLVSELERFGSTLLLTADRMRAEVKNGAGFDLEEYVDAYDFVDWLEQQETQYSYLIYEADPAYPHWTRRCIEQADRILIVARGDESPALSPVENLLGDIPHPDLTPPVELVLVHNRRDSLPTGTRDWLAQRTVSRHHHVALNHPPDFARLGRFLRDRALGIVFGGGGMRGLAHAGVIQALQERDIQCDMAGGTSSGAIVAALYGKEWSAQAIKDGTVKMIDRKTMFQLTIPLTALITGAAPKRVYQAMLGDLLIEDLWTAVFAIASNLTQAKMAVMDRGSLYKAVRASTSLAGILPPTVDENYDLLLDGGAFNNTPADVMRAYVGSGTVIAVDLGYTKREFPRYEYGDVVNGFKVLWSRINPFMERIDVPLIIDIMMRSNGLSGINNTAAQVAQADLVIKPAVTQYGLYDTEAADAIFNAGYEAGRQAFEDWRGAGGLRDTFLP